MIIYHLEKETIKEDYSKRIKIRIILYSRDNLSLFFSFFLRGK